MTSKEIRAEIRATKAEMCGVESEPSAQGNFTVLSGRIDIDGCPLVTKKFLTPMEVTIERN